MHLSHPTLCYLGLGSSLGDRFFYLKLAINGLSELPRTRVTAISNIYETEPVGGVARNQFLNAVLGMETTLSPAELLRAVHHIEAEAGRVRRMLWEDRTLDIDILFYGNMVVELDELRIPHPLVAQRRFVLMPLAEIARHFQHPITGRTVEAMLADCSDAGEVLVRPEMALTIQGF